jgi:hypothetical protein
MSIWSSIGIDQPSIVGLNYDDEDSHYRGLGEPCITVDVATTWHDHARLSISGEQIDAECLLPVEELRRLADYLIRAAESCEKTRDRLPDWREQAARVEEFHQREAESRQQYLEKVSARFQTE